MQTLNNDKTEESGGWKILCYFKFCVYLRILYTFCCILMFVTFVNLFFVYLFLKKLKKRNTWKKKKKEMQTHPAKVEVFNVI